SRCRMSRWFILMRSSFDSASEWYGSANRLPRGSSNGCMKKNRYFFFACAMMAPTLSHLHDDLDRILDTLGCVADRGRHLLQREAVRVEKLRRETLLRHQRRRPAGRAPALAADAKHVDVVADQ